MNYKNKHVLKELMIIKNFKVIVTFQVYEITEGNREIQLDL